MWHEHALRIVISMGNMAQHHNIQLEELEKRSLEMKGQKCTGKDVDRPHLNEIGVGADFHCFPLLKSVFRCFTRFLDMKLVAFDLLSCYLL